MLRLGRTWLRTAIGAQVPRLATVTRASRAALIMLGAMSDDGNEGPAWVCTSWHEALHRPAKWAAALFLLGSLACAALDCRTRSGDQVFLVTPVPRWLVHSCGYALLLSVAAVAIARAACKHSCR
jgi:hypothetical protein